ncbi:MAG: thioredoxin-disulfide reductase [Lachnospiraceae bacterium]|nr:thioredoxin-disulfide reductase [Lachnospiraceae bacterium]
MYDIIIIGAGTAGLSAAIYGLRAGKKVLVLEQLSYGGQIINTPEIENYPGIKNISGFDFATGLYEQATALGAEVKYEQVTGIADGAEKQVTTTEATYSCKAIIIATGARNRPLGLDREAELVGGGVSYCATCDGAFYKKRPVAVNGGGNTALEDALFLSNYCSKVYLIHRRDTFRGEVKQVEQLKAKENVEFVLNSTVTALLGEDQVEGIEVTDKITGEKRTLQVDGLFIAIGQMPENAVFAPLIELDTAGYVVAGEDCKTNVEGIYAAGDCRTKTVRQLTTAAADGAVAALAACAYIG